MTERKYINSFIVNYGKYWLIATIVGLLLGVGAASQLQPTYEGVVSFTLNKKQELPQSTAPFYLYDGYYSEQAAILARNNLALWLQSPKTVYDVYSNAGLPLPKKSSQAYSRIFRVSDDVTPTGTSTLDLTFPSSNLADGEKLGRTLTTYVKNSYTTNDISVTSSDPLVLTVDPPRGVVVLGATLTVALLGFLSTLIAHYFKS